MWAHSKDRRILVAGVLKEGEEGKVGRGVQKSLHCTHHVEGMPKLLAVFLSFKSSLAFEAFV